MNVEINDIRSQQEFKGITFSNFQKSKVKAELLKCLSMAKVESACYWAAELICSAHLIDLWDCIILYCSKEIHLGSPRLPVYISKRFIDFKNIISNGYIGQEIRLRNNIKIRNLFSELIAILCFSNKKHSFSPVKLKKDSDFNMTDIAGKLVAPNVEFASGIFKKSDPKELFISINEFAYHLTKTKSAVNACYWLEWIMEFENRCKKQKSNCDCERRLFPPVLEKYQLDPIWIVWEIILKKIESKNNLILNKIADALLEMYCIKYTSGIKRRRRFILYFAISLLTETYNTSIPIMENAERISKILKNTDVVYRDVKKNEKAPATGYLDVGSKMSNLDKTIERLEKMGTLDKF